MSKLLHYHHSSRQETVEKSNETEAVDLQAGLTLQHDYTTNTFFSFARSVYIPNAPVKIMPHYSLYGHRWGKIGDYWGN
jgi:hypothetical protein